MEEAWLAFACEPTVERRGILNEAKQLLFSTYDNIKGEELMERVQIVQSVHGERQYGEAWTRTKEEDQKHNTAIRLFFFTSSIQLLRAKICDNVVLSSRKPFWFSSGEGRHRLACRIRFSIIRL